MRDLQSVHGTLETLGFDAARAVLWGASYGGYMTLAGLAFQPELWAAGVDIVGISQRRGVRHELRVYDDEGHGLARLANQLDAYPRAIQFLNEVLGVSVSYLVTGP